MAANRDIRHGSSADDNSSPKEVEKILNEISTRSEVSKENIAEELDSEWQNLVIMSTSTYTRKKVFQAIRGILLGVVVGFAVATGATFLYSGYVLVLRVLFGPWKTPNITHAIFLAGAILVLGIFIGIYRKVSH